MIRFAYEMNLSPGAGIPWGGGPGAVDGNTAADYIAAWRHVVGIYRADGATNAEFVWAPNIDDGGIPFNQYFPGDEWVNEVGLDGYNWGSAFESTGHKWLSLGDTFASSYATLTQLSSKPVIFTETASPEIGGDKAAWIRRGFLNEIPQLFPRVTGVIWFDVQKEADWRVDSSQASLEAFREVAASSLYGGPVPYQPFVEETPPVVEEVHVTKRIQGGTTATRASAEAMLPPRHDLLPGLAEVEVRDPHRAEGPRQPPRHPAADQRQGPQHGPLLDQGRRPPRSPGRLQGLGPAVANGKQSREKRAGFRVLKR